MEIQTDITTGIKLDEVNQIQSLNAFVRVVEAHADPTEEPRHDDLPAISGALEFYRELWGESPSAHTGELVTTILDAQDIADAVTVLLADDISPSDAEGGEVEEWECVESDGSEDEIEADDSFSEVESDAD